MNRKLSILQDHRKKLYRCRKCPEMQSSPVSGEAVLSRILLVGQAPGVKEPVLQRPFAWTAGKKLFTWFSSIGFSEAEVRERIYFAAVCRCFPGKSGSGGDRAPSDAEVENCSFWLDQEISILQPKLIIPVGKMAIQQFIDCPALADVIGKVHRSKRSPKSAIIPLPHPSGASPWVHQEPGRTLLRSALKILAKHPEIERIRAKI